MTISGILVRSQDRTDCPGSGRSIVTALTRENTDARNRFLIGDETPSSLYRHTEGETYIDDVEWPLKVREFAPPSPAGYLVTDPMQAKEVCVMRTPANYVDAWHPVPNRVLVTLLSGRLRLETSNGDAHIIETGQQVLYEDDWGKGHRMNEIDGREYNIALVFLAALE